MTNARTTALTTLTPLLGLLALALAARSTGCAQPVCAQPDYRDPECRVQAENELARVRSALGAELRFQAPEAEHPDSWDARGLLLEPDPGTITARVAAPGAFAISIEPRETHGGALEIELHNVHPRAIVTLSRGPANIDIPAEGATLQRRVSVPLDDDQTQWIRGALDCPARYRVAAFGDVQTGVAQLERILDALADEADEAEALGEPLLGVLLLGDLTDRSRDEEFARLGELLRRAPAPIAITAGNHDVFRAYAPHYNLTFGPGNYAFELCRARVVMLDSGSGNLADSIEGRLPELLARDMDRAPHLVVGTHYPAYAGLTGNGWTREEQAQHLLALMVSERADLLLTGHIHALRAFDDVAAAGGTVREIISGTGGAAQGAGPVNFGYLRLTFGDAVELCFVEVPPAGALSGERDQPLPTCP